MRPGDVIDIREIRESERRLKHSQLFEHNPAQGISPKIIHPESGNAATKTQLSLNRHCHHNQPSMPTTNSIQFLEDPLHRMHKLTTDSFEKPARQTGDPAAGVRCIFVTSLGCQMPGVTDPAISNYTPPPSNNAVSQTSRTRGGSRFPTTPTGKILYRLRRPLL